ncbi:MAG: InlB B-repeat-containing protein, partial [Desulfamplus sp.]|nr:InlB B-repeat-containing protein [Desulfamplus sp.]
SGSSGSPLNLILSARGFAGATETTLGDIKINANIKSYGGNITMGGGDDVASDYAIATGTSSNVGGVIINGSYIIDATGDGSGAANTTIPTAATGGNITIRGKGNTNATQCNWGVQLRTASLITAGDGAVEVVGYGGNSANNFWGVASVGVSIENNSYIKAKSGNITIKGYAGTGFDRYGIASADGGINNFIGTNGTLILDGNSLLIRDGTLKVQGGATGIDIKAPIVGCQTGNGCAASTLIAYGAGELRLYGDAQAWSATNTSATRIDNIFTSNINFVSAVAPTTMVQALHAFGGVIKYTITYDANGATSGSAPSQQAKTHDVDLTLATNTGGLAKTGYTFDGWNTKADGTGTDYAAGGVCAANVAITLYAKWTSSSSYYILNNDKLRFGNGNENSINNTGNLQQPLYYNNGWQTLTIGANPLNFSIAIDGDGTNEWNLNQYILNADLNLRNLSILDDPPLTGQTIDTSGFTPTEGGLKGYGTIISTGTVNIGGKNVEIKNTYQLLQDKAYITVATRIRNVSGSSVSNIRYWVGTRDDWIGNTDGPRKEKGNLVDGAFAKITNPSERALAIKITTGSEGVLFYTDSNKANTIINSCCSWTNVINQDPQTGTIDVTGDGSYGFYVRLNDLDDGASDEFTWYYAAGTITDLNAIINDVASASSAVSDITYESAKLTATSDVDGTGYWIVVAKDATAPTNAEIEAAATYSGVTVVASGNGAMTASVAKEFSITGLQPATDYDLYFVIKDTATPSSYSAISKSQFTTKLISPTGVTATAGNASAVVSWTASSGATSYQVTGSPSGSCTATAPATTCTVAGLTNGTTYTFAVTASNGSTTSLASSPSNSVTPSDSYTITGTARAWAGGGTVLPATQTVNTGGTTTLTITPSTGSSISTVTGCGGNLSGNTYTTGAINANCTVTATFTRNSYTVTSSAGAGGSITPATRAVAHDGTTTFTITPNWGYELTNLAYCGSPITPLPSLSGNIYTYTTSAVTGNCTLEATFAKKTYTVTAVPADNGSISPTDTINPVKHGDKPTFTVTPNDGYEINYVLGCGGVLSGTSPNYTYTTDPVKGVTGDCTIMAFFKSK